MFSEIKVFRYQAVDSDVEADSDVSMQPSTIISDSLELGGIFAFDSAIRLKLCNPP